MKITASQFVTVLLTLSVQAAVLAQETGTTPEQETRPASEELEPAVNTSAPEPAVDTSAPEQQPAPTRSRGSRAQDRIELEATQITGNRELPRVLYIVPWKRSDLGDLAGKPVNSLVDEVLEPVDRDVFRRENRYYQAVAADKPPEQALPAQAEAPSSGPEN